MEKKRKGDSGRNGWRKII